MTGRLMVLAFIALFAGCEGDAAPPGSQPASGSSNDPEGEDLDSVPELLGPADSKTTEPAEQSKPAAEPEFRDIATSAGVDFTYFNDDVPGRYFLPEVMGGGVGWVDFDQDGRLDLYLMNGTRLRKGRAPSAGPVNHLYRNQANGTFADVTAPSRSGHCGYGQGCAVGDFNADGFPDLYLSNYGPNALLLNNGDGTFQDVTARAGLGASRWSTSAAWFDADGDRDLDLYVVGYLDVSFANHRVCRYNGRQGYCGPGEFAAVADRLYLNRGDGTFDEAAEKLGFRQDGGKGLGVIVLDFNRDLRPEVYVANDMTPNFLFTQVTEAKAEPPRYQDIAPKAGCAVNRSGLNEASMGIACADFDTDGRIDIFLTHYFEAKNTLYRNLGNLLFLDESRRTRIAATSFSYLGFGTAPLDYDQDGTADLFVANGHVLGPEQQPNRMPPQLLHNNGQGRFRAISAQAGPYFRGQYLGRGVAAGDYDNDGDTDLAISHLQSPMALLRNETENDHHFLGLKLISPDRMPPVAGRIVVKTRKDEFVQPVTAGGSYLSSSDPRLLCGLGPAKTVQQLTVFWPGGTIDRFEDVPADHYYRLIKGHALVP